MKCSRSSFIAVVMLGSFSASCPAALVGGWDFSTMASQASGPWIADVGSGTMSVSNAGGTSGIEGTTLNAAAYGLSTVTTAPQALQFSGQQSNNDALLIHFSMTGVEGLTLSFAAQASATTYTQTWEASVNGGTYQPLGGYSPPLVTSGTWAVYTWDLSGFTAADHQADVALRVTLTGNTPNSNTIAFDNVVVTAVPEPGGIALAVSVAVVVASGWRTDRHRQRSATRPSSALPPAATAAATATTTRAAAIPAARG